MELISNRCTQCMGEVEPMADGIHAKCIYCGAVYLLPEEERVHAPQASNAAAAERTNARAADDYEGDGEFDLEGIIADVLDPVRGELTSSLWGGDVSEKEGAARKFFGIPRGDDVYYILDTTIFGSCKVGLALTTTGVCMKDEDGAVRCIDWDELCAEVEFSYEDGTLDIDDSEFYSSDGEYVVEILDRACDAYGQGGTDDGEFDLEGIIADVLDPVRGELTSSLWGNDVSEKEGAARKFFGIPRGDDVYYILDTTIFGSCKVGLALASSGIYFKDEDGAVRGIEWDEFRDEVEFSYEDGTLDIDGSEFYSSDGDYVFDVLEEIRSVL